jgi:hypothetical protein
MYNKISKFYNQITSAVIKGITADDGSRSIRFRGPVSFPDDIWLPELIREAIINRQDDIRRRRMCGTLATNTFDVRLQDVSHIITALEFVGYGGIEAEIEVLATEKGKMLAQMLPNIELSAIGTKIISDADELVGYTIVNITAGPKITFDDRGDPRDKYNFNVSTEIVDAQGFISGQDKKALDKNPFMDFRRFTSPAQGPWQEIQGSQGNQGPIQGFQGNQGFYAGSSPTRGETSAQADINDGPQSSLGYCFICGDACNDKAVASPQTTGKIPQTTGKICEKCAKSITQAAISKQKQVPSDGVERFAALGKREL